MDNLLQIKFIGSLLRSTWCWRLLRLTCLVLLVAMVAWGWHHHDIGGVDARDPLMYTSLTNHLFWVWWIMGIVFIALLFGRAWCTVCPLGWLNGIASRFGLRRDIPPWLRNFIPVSLVLILLQLSVYFLAIHRFPDYTAVLLALCLLLAIAAGLLFRERAFCTLFCPAGAVFGLYARIAPFQLRVKDRAVCAGCDSQRCIAEPVEWQRYQLGSTVLHRRNRLDGCPVGLVPAEIADSADCTLCLTCLHNCDKENVKVGFRSWLADLKTGGLRLSETFFLLVLVGLLTANFSKVYVDLRELIFWLPQQSAQLLGWQEPGFYLLAVIWIAILLPLVIFLPGYVILRLGEMRQTTLHSEPGPPIGDLPSSTGFWSRMGRLVLSSIPMILAAHVVLALVKLNAKAGYLPYAIGDPSGVTPYLAFNIMQTVTPPGVLLPLDTLKWVIAALLVAWLALSIFASRVVARGLDD